MEDMGLPQKENARFLSVLLIDSIDPQLNETEKAQ